MPLQALGQIIVAGFLAGSMYAFVALGYDLIFNVSGVVNLAQGEFFVYGAFFMLFFTGSLGLPVLLAFPLVIACVMGVGLLVEKAVIRREVFYSPSLAICITLGVSSFSRGLTLLTAGSNPYKVPPLSGERIFKIFGVAIHSQMIWVFAFTLLVAVCLYVFFEKTIYGKAMRACAENQPIAYLVGIPATTMVRLSFLLSGGLGGLAGLLISPITLVDYESGSMIGFKAFVATVLGGIGSYPGAMLGGLLLGLFESLGAGYISSVYRDTIAFVILLFLFSFRPYGLFGKKTIS
jgi:branched-chain amino acid transport system permease protein